MTDLHERVAPPGSTSYQSSVNGEPLAMRMNGSTPQPITLRVVLLPDSNNGVRWSRDVEELVLEISRARLVSHLAVLIGRPVSDDVDLDLDVDLSTPCGRSLVASVQFLARELDRPGGIAQMPLAREQLELFVMTQLLLAARSSYTDELTGSSPQVGRRLQPVLDHMEANIAQSLTPRVLARVGCMSVRALHVAFQQELGMSPMAYLRRIRMDHVHAELLRHAGHDVRISDIAVRWGFYHPSRFARQYQQRYGELPSETLRRQR